MTVVDVLDVRRELRALLQAEHGVPASGRMRGRAGPQIENPFGSGRPVEGKTIRAIPVEGADAMDAGFADGIQRFSVESWVNGVPVVRGYAAAGVLVRTGSELTPWAAPATEEFVVAPLDMLSDRLRSKMMELPVNVFDVGATDRAHPLADLRRCALVVEQRRRLLERRVCETFHLENPDQWLVVDGSLRGLDGDTGSHRRLGLIKSHETQFLAGADLKEAITLEAAHRTTVFERDDDQGNPVLTWYVRLWDWSGQDLLFGLVRLERLPHATVLEEVDRVSGWIYGERAPVADDPRSDRLIYPMHRVEAYLRARAGGWA